MYLLWSVHYTRLNALAGLKTVAVTKLKTHSYRTLGSVAFVRFVRERTVAGSMHVMFEISRRNKQNKKKTKMKCFYFMALVWNSETFRTRLIFYGCWFTELVLLSWQREYEYESLVFDTIFFLFFFVFTERTRHLTDGHRHGCLALL